MEQFARTTSNSSVEIVKVARPYSFFDFPENKFQPCYSIRRLLSQVRLLGCNTMVVEELVPSKDLQEENEDLQTLVSASIKSQAYRLSFFNKEFSTKLGLEGAADQDFIGYAIIKRDEVPTRGVCLRIYESVLKPSRHPNNYIRGTQDWTCRVIDEHFTINGYIYAQQNGMTNVCAHVALRTAAACYHTNGDMSYREMNEIAGIDHVSRKLDSQTDGGLTTEEMANILEAIGARCFKGEYTSTTFPKFPFQKYLYGSIESGFPSLVIFETLGRSDICHAIPVFGHTFNEDTWVPSADFSYFRIGEKTCYIPSESWMSMFIAHDDNWGSNYCIPRRYLHTKRICRQLDRRTKLCPQESESVAYVISTVPQKIKVSPMRAEAIGADFLFTVLSQAQIKTTWNRRLQTFNSENRLVLRPILVSGKEYIDHLAKIRDWDEQNCIRRVIIKDLRNNLRNDYYWMIELSIPNLFETNRRKVGEVLIRAEEPVGSIRNMHSFMFCRLPGEFAIYTGGNAQNPKFRFIKSGIERHAELFGCEDKK